MCYYSLIRSILDASTEITKYMSVSIEQAAGQNHKLSAIGAENLFEYQEISITEGYNWSIEFKSLIRCQNFTFGRQDRSV